MPHISKLSVELRDAISRVAIRRLIRSSVNVLSTSNLSASKRNLGSVLFINPETDSSLHKMICNHEISRVMHSLICKHMLSVNINIKLKNKNSCVRSFPSYKIIRNSLTIQAALFTVTAHSYSSRLRSLNQPVQVYQRPPQRPLPRTPEGGGGT